AIEARLDESLGQSEPAESPSPRASASASATASAAPSPAPSAAAPEPPRVASRTQSSSVIVAARASTVTGIGPRLALGLGAFVDFGVGPLRLALGVDYLRTGTVEKNDRSADFDLLAARADLCPFPLFASQDEAAVGTATYLCGALSAGRLHGAGE